MYRPKPWATVSGAFNDLERHNNTNNMGAAPIDGPLNHVDHSRIVSMGAVLSPNEHYGFDFNYAYSDVYAATNICYLNGATATLPGAVPTATTDSMPWRLRQGIDDRAFGLGTCQGLHGCSHAVSFRRLSV